MEITKVAQNIETQIKVIKSLTLKIKAKAEEMAQTGSEYEKQLAITIIRLQNGSELPLGDVVARDVKQTTLERIAKGICYDYALKRDLAQGMYKGLITTIEAEKAVLNGYQSIFRHLDEN